MNGIDASTVWTINYAWHPVGTPRPADAVKLWQNGEIDPETGKPVFVISRRIASGWCIVGAMGSVFTQEGNRRLDPAALGQWQEFNRRFQGLLASHRGTRRERWHAMLTLAAEYVTFK